MSQQIIIEERRSGIKEAGYRYTLAWKARKRTYPHETPRARGWYFNPHKKDIVRWAKS